MASSEAQMVVSMMKSSKVTANEAMAFMGQALTVMERTKSGASVAFLKELLERRESRSLPDLSSYIS